MDKRAKLVLGGAVFAGAAVGVYYFLRGRVGSPAEPRVYAEKEAIVAILTELKKMMGKVYHRVVKRASTFQRIVEGKMREEGLQLTEEQIRTSAHYYIFEKTDDVAKNTEEVLKKILETAKISREEFKDCVESVYAKEPEVARLTQAMQENMERAVRGEDVEVEAELPEGFNKLKFLSYTLSLVDGIIGSYLDISGRFLEDNIVPSEKNSLFVAEIERLDITKQKEALYVQWGFCEGGEDPALIYQKAKQVYRREDAELRRLFDLIEGIEIHVLTELFDGKRRSAEQLEQLKRDVDTDSRAIWKSIAELYGEKEAPKEAREEAGMEDKEDMPAPAKEESEQGPDIGVKARQEGILEQLADQEE